MLRLAIPIVLAELGWMAMGVVDTIMVGRLPDSAAAIGAVSVGGTIFYTVALFGSAVLLGLDTLVSQSFGAGDLDDCRHSLINGAWVSLAVSPPIILALYFGAPRMELIGIHPSVLAGAVPYLQALTWSTLPLAFYFGFRRYLQSVNVVRPVTFTLVTANLVNLIGNYIFVYGKWGMPAMGVVGSAWSTVAARVYMAIALLAVILWHDRKHGSRLLRSRLRPEFDRIRYILRLGLPAAVQIGLEIAVFAAATALCARLGPVAVAAHQVVLTCASVTFMVPMGVSSATAVRVGQAIGRGDLPAAARAGWAGLALGAGFMLACAAIFFFFGHALVFAFSPDPEVIRLGVVLLLIAAAFQLFDGIQVVSTGALRGAGETRIPAVLSLVAYWVLGLPIGSWLAFHLGWGAVGLWMGLALGLIIVACVLLTVWRRKTRSWVEAGSLVTAGEPLESRL